MKTVAKWVGLAFEAAAGVLHESARVLWGLAILASLVAAVLVHPFLLCATVFLLLGVEE